MIVVALAMVNEPVQPALTEMVAGKPTKPLPVIVKIPVPAAGQFDKDEPEPHKVCDIEVIDGAGATAYEKPVAEVEPPFVVTTTANGPRPVVGV